MTMTDMSDELKAAFVVFAFCIGCVAAVALMVDWVMTP